MHNRENGKAFRRSLHSAANYHKGLDKGEETVEQMKFDYEGRLLRDIRANGSRFKYGDITLLLAESFGFCWGVERAVSMAYEARQQFPQHHIWITGEIIHNPFVNQKLRDIQIELIPEAKGIKDFSKVCAEDVVVIPGAGATFEELQLLKARKCIIVDTTCPWVVKVWNTVEKHKKADYTSIIHGKCGHDETVATSSFAHRYLIVQNYGDAELICNYILHGGDKAQLMGKFAHACSLEFDLDKDLDRIGIANQTTMLQGETEQIGKLFERTLMRKHGLSNLNWHFQPFNTICGATQERQNAMEKLLKEPLDTMVVIGGFNSSNTTHLHQMAIQQGIRSFHIDSPTRISSNGYIEHQTLEGNLAITQDWFPQGKITIGVTAGASTPDSLTEGAIANILQLRNCSAPV